MKPFQMTLKKPIWILLPPGAFVFYKHTRVLSLKLVFVCLGYIYRSRFSEWFSYKSENSIQLRIKKLRNFLSEVYNIRRNLRKQNLMSFINHNTGYTLINTAAILLNSIPVAMHLHLL